jgi:hypothetical protein
LTPKAAPPIGLVEGETFAYDAAHMDFNATASNFSDALACHSFLLTPFLDGSRFVEAFLLVP